MRLCSIPRYRAKELAAERKSTIADAWRRPAVVVAGGSEVPIGIPEQILAEDASDRAQASGSGGAGAADAGSDGEAMAEDDDMAPDAAVVPAPQARRRTPEEMTEKLSALFAAGVEAAAEAGKAGGEVARACINLPAPAARVDALQNLRPLVHPRTPFPTHACIRNYGAFEFEPGPRVLAADHTGIVALDLLSTSVKHATLAIKNGAAAEKVRHAFINARCSPLYRVRCATEKLILTPPRGTAGGGAESCEELVRRLRRCAGNRLDGARVQGRAQGE